MDIKIYNIEQAVREALDSVTVDEETGEIIGMEHAQEVCTESAEKISNTAKYIRGIKYQIDAMRNAEREIAQRRRSAEKLVERFTELLGIGMRAIDTTKVEAPDVLVKFQKNPPAVTIFNEKEIPDEYMIFPGPPDPYPDKNKIKEALKAGEDVAGAMISQTTRVVIK